ncbi:unnamed protein product, partial [Brassica rapa]
MNRKRGNVHEGFDTAKKNKTASCSDMPNLEEIQRFSNPISIQPIPLSSIYFRLFETLENQHVPNYTIPPYQQIRKLSPQTPLNKRRCILGLEKIKDQVNDTPVLSSCLTSLSSKKKKCISSSSTFDAPAESIQEEDGLVGTDLFGGFIDTDSQQVFECSSLENTDTENGDSDLDDHMDYEPEVEPNNSERVAPNSEHIVGVVKAPKPPNQKCFSENEYLDEGDPDYNCSHCGAIMWPYNMVFSFTSLGGRVERSLKKGRGPDMFQLQGENYHLLGAGITPPEGSEPKFGQLYIVDTENEVENRAKCLSLGKRPFQVKKKDHLRKDIIETLMKMLNEVNPYVKKFRSARDRFNTDPENSFHMRIVSERLKDGRTYNTPTASEVAALIPGDFSLDMDRRDIVLQK